MQGKLAVVTGASTGIGKELARLAAKDGMTVVIVAEEPSIETARAELAAGGGTVEAVQADLSSHEGVDRLIVALGGRPVDVLMANAGVGLGEAFLDQDEDAWTNVIDVNVFGTTLLAHRIGRTMRARGSGRILFTGSIAGFMPGAYQAVYNATKAYVDSFSYALRNELKDTGVTVTCLMPGPVETEFFHRAGLDDTAVGESKKSDPAKVAADGYREMMAGDAGVVSGFMNKVQAAFAGIIPDTVLAEMHRKMAEPHR